MSNIRINESELIDKLIDKVNNIKETLIKIKNHQNTQLSIDYLQKLSEFSSELNKLAACSDDMYDDYILNAELKLLSSEEINRRKNIIINKKIQDIFLPYMLYLQVILQNN